jgi:hypothetical protein
MILLANKVIYQHKNYLIIQVSCKELADFSGSLDLRWCHVWKTNPRRSSYKAHTDMGVIYVFATVFLCLILSGKNR